MFSLLVACGLGLPLPEDIALITGGFLAALGPPHGVGSVTLMVFVGLAGILVGDSIIFKAGQDYGEKLLDTSLGKHIPRERVARIRELFARHGAKFIVVARFLPGVRAVTYFVAGTSKVPYWQFLAYDGLAAIEEEISLTSAMVLPIARIASTVASSHFPVGCPSKTP